MGHKVSYFNWLSVMTLKNKMLLCPILILQGFKYNYIGITVCLLCTLLILLSLLLCSVFELLS